MVKVEFTGDWKRIAARLSALKKTGPQAVVIGMSALAERIMADAVRRVPVATGLLRSSGYIAPPSRLSRGDQVELGFGADYAVPVHERTEVRHATGEAKFLERAIVAHTSGGLREVAAAAEAAFEKGGQPGASKFPQSPRT